MSKNNLSKIFDIRTGETKIVCLFLFYSLLLGISGMFFRTMSYSLFLVEYSSNSLPFIYIGIAIFLSLSAFGYLKLERKISFSNLMKFNLGFVIILLLIIKVFLIELNIKWITLVLPIINEIIWVAVSLCFWGLINQVFSVRQGKRLFGILGSGELVAEIIGGFLIPILVPNIGTVNLVNLCLIFYSTAFIVMLIILKNTLSKSQSQHKAIPDFNDNTSIQNKKTIIEFIKTRYTLIIIAISFLSIFAYYFIDNLFYSQALSKYMDENYLASFIGQFFAILNLFTLLNKILVTSNLIKKYGIIISLSTLPLFLLTCTIIIISSDIVFTSELFIFTIIIITKSFDTVFRFSINSSSMLLLYQALKSNDKIRLQTVIEGIVEPIATGLSGLLLLFFTRILIINLTSLFNTLLLVLLMWIGLIFLIRKEYIKVLSANLSKRQLNNLLFSANDKMSTKIIFDSLQSTKPGAVLYALNLLDEIEIDEKDKILIELLDHPSAEVRFEVLKKIQRSNMNNAFEAVQKKFENENNPVIQGQYLTTLTAIGGIEIVDYVAEYLKNPDYKIRAGAIVGLIKSGGIEGVLYAGKEFIAMVNSEDPEKRIIAAKILGDIGISNFYRLLLQLLDDVTIDVRKKAIYAARNIKNEKLVDSILQNFDITQLHKIAEQTLICLGDLTIDKLKEMYYKNNQKINIKIKIIRVLGKIKTPLSISLIKENINSPDKDIKHEIYHALFVSEYHCKKNSWAERNSIIQSLNAEVQYSIWIINCLVSIKDEQKYQLLINALKYERDKSRERILYFLSFIYQALPMSKIQVLFETKISGQKDYALELLDNVVSKKFKKLIFPIFDDIPNQQILEYYKELYPQKNLSEIEVIEELLTHNNNVLQWTNACAIYSAGLSKNPTLIELATSFTNTEDELIKDTANLILNRKIISEKEFLMLSVIEKVIILKSIDLFSKVPEHVLVELASYLQEINTRENETIIKKGEVGTSMYIIVSGRVKVHIKQETLAELKEGDFFGEMSALDSEVRSASVTTLEDTLLFSINQESMYELISNYTEIAKGIIQVLSRRIRNMMKAPVN